MFSYFIRVTIEYNAVHSLFVVQSNTVYNRVFFCKIDLIKLQICKSNINIYIFAILDSQNPHMHYTYDACLNFSKTRLPFLCCQVLQFCLAGSGGAIFEF